MTNRAQRVTPVLQSTTSHSIWPLAGTSIARTQPPSPFHFSPHPQHCPILLICSILLSLASLISFISNYLSITIDPSISPTMKFTLSTIVLSLALLLAPAKANPQGVYDIITPGGAAPAGCFDSFPDRFSVISQKTPNNGITNVCDKVDGLSVILRGGIMTDRQGRIGSIVANRQFQFDGPPAQAGAIYTGGWSVCPGRGIVALGSQTKFFRCLSGTCEYPVGFCRVYGC